ncbi:XPG I-region-domain-containing protein [Lentinula edodes]|uniref:XPG I-region-domain-containing protein n=1 Tax=Lentinula edodes TaxID=5353 RepID=UPI001E8D618C|nr:XPG I-region-domain-containing protein [Lentinula edodes]KAH7875492.1 XPG I-region-domain-containing protein [Lentinula edodes]
MRAGSAFSEGSPPGDAPLLQNYTSFSTAIITFAMGVRNLWPLVDGAAVTIKLRDFMVDNGFITDHYRLRTTLIGVDIRVLIEAFGYYAHTAPGEADAELAEMCKRGLVDAVFTKDSDLLPFGAPRIFRPLRIDHKPRNFKDFETVLMYNADDGVNGIGSETAAGLAKCGYGDDLLNAHRSFSTMPQQLAEALADSITIWRTKSNSILITSSDIVALTRQTCSAYPNSHHLEIYQPSRHFWNLSPAGPVPWTIQEHRAPRNGHPEHPT